jgi:hypothetical protein
MYDRDQSVKELFKEETRPLLVLEEAKAYGVQLEEVHKLPSGTQYVRPFAPRGHRKRPRFRQPQH